MPILPLLIPVFVLGFIVFGISSLTGPAAPTTMLLAQAIKADRSADTSGCSAEKYAPNLSFPQPDPKTGKPGVIGAPCSQTDAGHTTSGQCIAIDDCKANAPSNQPQGKGIDNSAAGAEVTPAPTVSETSPLLNTQNGLGSGGQALQGGLEDQVPQNTSPNQLSDQPALQPQNPPAEQNPAPQEPLDLDNVGPDTSSNTAAPGNSLLNNSLNDVNALYQGAPAAPAQNPSPDVSAPASFQAEPTFGNMTSVPTDANAPISAPYIDNIQDAPDWYKTQWEMGFLNQNSDLLPGANDGNFNQRFDNYNWSGPSAVEGYTGTAIPDWATQLEVNDGYNFSNYSPPITLESAPPLQNLPFVSGNDSANVSPATFDGQNTSLITTQPNIYTTALNSTFDPNVTTNAALNQAGTLTFPTSGLDTSLQNLEPSSNIEDRTNEPPLTVDQQNAIFNQQWQNYVDSQSDWAKATNYIQNTFNEGYTYLFPSQLQIDAGYFHIK